MSSLGRINVIAWELAAECLGTWMLTFFGTGTVAAAVALEAQVGLWQVAVVWGFGVALSIYLTAHVSGAHLNPSVSLSLAVSCPSIFPRWKLLPYWSAQLLGSVIAGFCVLLIFGTAISRYESRNFIQRGADNSTLSAMMFGEYFPNPQVVKAGVLAETDISPPHAMAIEAFGTMILMVLIRSLTDRKNAARPSSEQVPFFIGFTVAALISLLAPLTQAGFNPARDFGPRIVAAAAGWGTIAIPGPRNGFWVYIVGPCIGSLCGGFLYDYIVYPSYLSKLQGDGHRLVSDKEMVVDAITLHNIVAEACSKTCTPPEPCNRSVTDRSTDRRSHADYAEFA